MVELNFKAIIEQSGGVFLGVRNGSVFFRARDGVDTLSLYCSACTSANVALALKSWRERVTDFPPLMPTDSLSF